MGHVPSSAEARSILHEFTQSPNLRKHAEAVAAAMRAYAERWSEDADRWEAVGLLHDFDYERYPTLEEHPFKGSEILRSRGVDEEFIRDILAHAPHTNQPRDTRLRKAVFACDEVAGFIVAVALVTPHTKLSEVTVDKILKKLREKRFAANVSREDIQKGAEALGFPLSEHVGYVLSALRVVADRLGL